LALRVFGADCAPVFLFDPVARVLGLAHAGRRGAALKILTATVEKMKKYGARPDRMVMALGPHIGACCYQVGRAEARPFRRYPGAVRPWPGDPSGRTAALSLGAALLAQADGVGLKRARIRTEAPCTACDRRFFSFRREKTDKRHAAVAALLCP
jgi:copper oxidase (laccase) domain-containing protein